jgi:transcriptional pleiotropic regulator of transition state genes
MKSTGIVRKIDDLGRITIPKELRRVLEIGIGDPVEIYSEADAIILKKYQVGCHCCGEMNELKEIPKLGIKLCPKCLLEVSENAAIIIKSLKEN